MELRQLAYFVAVAEEANFTRAAERLHVTQPGVSAQVRQLERELGAELFDRSARTAALTAAGEAAIGPARAALAAAGAVGEAVDDVNALLRGRLVVGMVTACTVTPLFDALAAFHTDHPGVTLALAEDTSDRLVESVRSGGTDLALVGTAGDPPDGLEILPVVREGLVAVVPADHPLARRRRRVHLADLVEHHPVVCLPPGTGIRTVFDRACAAAGLTATVALQASAPAAVVDLAARGLGVAVLSESMADDGAPGLRARPIAGIDIQAVLSLVWRPSPGPALRQLVAHCHRTFTHP
jgi:DNA-binding transcriptional LysR family regulator